MINEDESVVTFFITGHGSEFISREYEFNNMAIEPGLKRFLNNNITSYVAGGSAGMCSWNINDSTASKTKSEETYDIAKAEFQLHPNESTEEIINTYIQPKIQNLYVSGLQKLKLEHDEIIKNKVKEGIELKKAEDDYKVTIYDNHYRQIKPIYEKIFNIRPISTTENINNYNFSIINYKSNKQYINYLFNNVNFYNLLNANIDIKKQFIERFYEISFANRLYRHEFNDSLNNLIIEDYLFINTYDENKKKIWLEAFQWMAKLEIYVFFIRLLNITEIPNINFIYKDLYNRIERLIYKKDLENGFYYIINDELYTYYRPFINGIINKLEVDDLKNIYAKFVIRYSELVRVFRLLGFTSIYIIDESCRLLVNTLTGKANIGYGVDIPFDPENTSKRTERLINRSESKKIQYTRKKKPKPPPFGGKGKTKKIKKYNKKKKTI